MSDRLLVNNISLSYGKNQVLCGADLSVAAGEITCLLGPSGSGKTSLMRAISGFEPITNGEIHLGDTKLAAADYSLSPEARQVGMMFQDFALFPHLTVTGNIGFGLNKLGTGARSQRIADLLTLTGLSEYADKYPHELSGGQQQRLALARAIAPRPRILLMDEPFSAIDPALREQLAIEVAALIRRDNITALFITHDQNEAFLVADKIAVMNDGKIQQIGTPYDLYHKPVNRFVANFIGRGVMVRAVVDKGAVQTPLGPVTIPQGEALAQGAVIDLLIRPDDVIHDDESDLTLEIVSKTFRGAVFLYELKLGNQPLFCYTDSHHDHFIGEHLGVRLVMEHVTYFAC